MDKIRILFLSSDPSDAGRLRLGQELREIREKLQLSKQRDMFQLESREAVRPRDITQAIFDVKPQIVHFSGHGMSTGELCFENITGTVQPVAPSALSSLFELVSTHVQCVVLNACHSESQAKAIADYIPCVIGMNQAIGDSAAIAFSVGFYRALGDGRSFEESYMFGRTEIQLEGISEDLTPVVYAKKVEDSKDSYVVSSATKDSFIYTPITIKQDRSLFLELLKDFPPTGRGARFLQEQDLGSPIHSKDLEHIDHFLNSWADVMHEFLNTELEKKRQNLMIILSDFRWELSMNIWPVGSGDFFSMCLNDFEVREDRFEARDRLHKMVREAFDLYEDLLRCCRIMLGAVDDE
jgi:hypothetical protein